MQKQSRRTENSFHDNSRSYLFFLFALYLPNVPAVFADGSVAGENAGVGDVDERGTPPAILIEVHSSEARRGLDAGCKVLKDEKLVVLL